jgi:DnaJ-class molecular chaperone
VTAALALAVIAALAVWAGSLYLRPFRACPKCTGAGTVRRGQRRVKVCPRCKGLRRVQRFGSRTLHRTARKVRDGRQTAARYQQEDNDGTP